MGRTTLYSNAIPFAANEASLVHAPGRQIDWSRVPDSFKDGTAYTITVNDADAAVGDTALTVDALPVAIPAGTVLDFGELAADAYTVTLNDATASIGDTDITVLALPVAIPAGTVLLFSGGAGDTDEIAITAADAAAGATSITVVKLAHAIADTATASYPGVIQQQLAEVTAYAAAGATALVVEPLAGPILDNATATYSVRTASARKKIPAGTVMAQLSGGKIIPRSAVTGAETSTALLESTAVEDEEADNHDVGHGVIVGGVIFENLLPDWDGGSSGNWTDTYKDELIVAGVGMGWVWQTYADSTS